jgi:lipooligosaccharide transport system permease protein
MFLFSGTFFPLENLPGWAQLAALLFPLTHVTNLSRSLCFGEFDSRMLWGTAYLLAFNLIFFPLGLLKMNKRLIK